MSDDFSFYLYKKEFSYKLLKKRRRGRILHMTTVYFVRHAEPDYTNHNDMERPLTIKGKEDSKLVTKYLQDKNIDIVLSSPFVRSMETVKDFADSFGLAIQVVEDFRERKIDTVWIEDFNQFAKQQWNDFDYKLSDGECLREVQMRNIDALMQVIREYRDKNIVIGSHGTSMSTIINYYKPTFGYQDFEKIRTIMPWVVKLTFQGDELIQMNDVNLRLVIKRADINSEDARILIDELSDELQKITGNSGRASFHDADIHNPRSLFVVAMEEDIAVGCGAFRELSDNTAEVKRMYSRKKSVGVGGRILTYLEEQGKELGYSRFVLETRKCNEKAVSFYQRHGYKVIKNYGKYVEMPEAVCFEKILK